MASSRDTPLRDAHASNLARFTMSIQLQVVRILLLPQDRALRRVDPHTQAILLARRDLTHGEHALATAAKPQQRIDIFVERAAWKEGTLVGAQLDHGIARDVFHQM